MQFDFNQFPIEDITGKEQQQVFVRSFPTNILPTHWMLGEIPKLQESCDHVCFLCFIGIFLASCLFQLFSSLKERRSKAERDFWAFTSETGSEYWQSCFLGSERFICFLFISSLEEEDISLLNWVWTENFIAVTLLLVNMYLIVLVAISTHTNLIS